MSYMTSMTSYFPYSCNSKTLRALTLVQHTVTNRTPQYVQDYSVAVYRMWKHEPEK